MNDIKLTDKQQEFVSKVEQDFFNETKHIYILKGYAGTGKTVTSSQVAKFEPFKNILVAAPTVMAKNVLRNKLVTSVPCKPITYTTISKLVAIPNEIIKVMDKTYRLNKPGMDDLTDLMKKLKLNPEGIIIEREFINTDASGARFKDTKYIINEPKLKAEFEKRFKKMADKLVGQVEPSFDFKDESLIADELCMYDLVMVDELSMVGDESLTVLVNAWNRLNEYYLNNDQYYLSESARRKGRKFGAIPTLVFAGDGGQLPPVDEAVNKYFSLSNDELVADKLVGGVTTLDEILRSTDEIAKMASLIRKKLDPKIVAQSSTDGDIFKGDIDAFIRAKKDIFKDIDIALAYTRADTAKLNNAIREVKGFSGESAQEGETLTVLANSPVDNYNEPVFTNGEALKLIKIYETDDALQFFDDELYDNIRSGQFAVSKNDIDLIKQGLNLGIINFVEVQDTAGFIKKAFISTNINKPIAGEIKLLFETINDLSKLVFGVNPMLHLDFGYARTIHKSQGSEWDKVFGWITSKNIYGLKKRDPKNWQSLLYTMYTRGKSTVKFTYADLWG